MNLISYHEGRRKAEEREAAEQGRRARRPAQGVRRPLVHAGAGRGEFYTDTVDLQIRVEKRVAKNLHSLAIFYQNFRRFFVKNI